MGETADELRRASDAPAAMADTPRADDADAPEAEIAVIRQEIEQTRAEMSTTIDAIQQKLSPDTLVEQAKEAAQDAATQAVEQAKESVREATVGKAETVVRNVTGSAQDVMRSADHASGGVGSMVLATIKRNPVPAALAGLGLAWLWMKREQQPARSWSYQTAPGQYGGGQVYPGSWSQGGGSWYQNAGGRDQSRSSQHQGPIGGTIDRARDAAGGVVEGAQETLGQAAERAQGAAQSAGSAAGDVGSTVVTMIKQNPIPAALAGASLAWMWMNRTSNGSRLEQRYAGSAYGSPYGQSYQGRAQGMAGQAQATAGQLAGQVQDTAGQLAGQAQATAGQLAGQVQGTASSFASTAQDRASDAQSRVSSLLQESPLTVGAAALALGALVGASVPRTAPEDRMLGEARDTFMERAQEAAQETMGKVQRVAENLQDTAQEEARGQGLMQ